MDSSSEQLGGAEDEAASEGLEEGEVEGETLLIVESEDQGSVDLSHDQSGDSLTSDVGEEADGGWACEDAPFYCDRCHKWVPAAQLRGEQPSYLKGDNFFKFICCSEDGKESFERMRLTWQQVVMLAMYNLSLEGTGRQGYFRWKEDICAFIGRHWTFLLGARKKTSTWWSTVAGCLSVGSPTFFRSGAQEFGEPGWWKLVQNRPPTLRPEADKSSTKTKASRPAVEPAPAVEGLRKRGSRNAVENAIQLKEKRCRTHEAKDIRRAQKEAAGHADRGAASTLAKPSAGRGAAAGRRPDPVLEKGEVVDFSSLSSSDRTPLTSPSPSPPPDFRRAARRTSRRGTAAHQARLSRQRGTGDLTGGGGAAGAEGRPLGAGAEDTSPEKADGGRRARPRPPVRGACCRLRRLPRPGRGAAGQAAAQEAAAARRQAAASLLGWTRVSATSAWGSTAPRASGAGPGAAVRKYHRQELRILDRFQTNQSSRRGAEQRSVSFWRRLMGAETGSDQTIKSPYTSRSLKPFIRRDYESRPVKLRLLDEIRAYPHRKESSWTPEPSAPLDYCYVRPSHIPSVNAMCHDTFWPGVDLSECLQYPDFSVVVLYKKVVVGFGFMVPDVKYNEAYISFLLVHPEWRRAGIGTFMIYHLIQTCMGKDVTLHVSASNAAMLLYQKFGFKSEEYILDFYDKYYPVDSADCRHAFFLRLRR
ncbi:cysteine-rich protein 2-binding protein-like [Pseudoliparis swirei]|uniref:cysteine-rich protein 2-binding protein-like n=1 Tax=Pseudoliparis swirei TaxID=2059687 RepID=UPI0024BE8EF6|nr:cysteine-rich protein 2-binding protein-like [Pseudoliparis swirei]